MAGLIISVGLLVYVWYLGVFNIMPAEEKIMGGYRMVGLEYAGPYSKTGNYMRDVGEKLSSAGIHGKEGFGIYYDNPDLVPEDKCRSFVGVLLDDRDVIKTEQLKAEGFRIDSVPLKAAVVSSFPIRSSLSYMIGPMKAYPKLSRYMKEKNYAADLSMELYNKAEGKITFIQFVKTDSIR